MGGREVLREVMTESKVSQSELSRMSGVRQPSISQFLSGRIEMSDEMLDRLHLSHVLSTGETTVIDDMVTMLRSREFRHARA